MTVSIPQLRDTGAFTAITEPMSAPSRAEILAALVAAKSLCFTWRGTQMIPRETHVGLDEESCRRPDAPTLDEVITEKHVDLYSIQHLFGWGCASTAPNAYSLHGMGNGAQQNSWRALVLFLGLESVTVFRDEGSASGIMYEALQSSHQVQAQIRPNR